MPGDWTFYLAAVPAVVLLGLSKGGFSGLSTMAMPLLALAISPVKAAAIVLPILIPGALIGIAAGWLLAARVNEAAVRLAVGLISIGFVVFMLLRDRLKGDAAAPANVAPGVFWGALAGFTSFVSHTGAPPLMVYVMPQRLSPRVFAGTLTMFFATVNLLKVPPYFLLGQFSRANLTASATLFPLAIAATVAGVWLVRRVSAERFYVAVLALTFLVGVKLIWDGAWGLWG